MSTLELNEDPAPLPQQEPDAFACCNSDCGDSCVWTIYQYAQRRYEADLLAWQMRQLAQDD